MNKLLALVAAIDGRPTLDEADEILAELGRMRSHPAASEITDALLDYRALLADAALEDPPPATA
jgi:hypothetical protein